MIGYIVHAISSFSSLQPYAAYITIPTFTSVLIEIGALMSDVIY
jgi:hypothetical protein